MPITRATPASQDFQLVSLKLIASELLFSCPGHSLRYGASYIESGNLDGRASFGASLYDDIYVQGEITELPLKFKNTVRVYISPNNPGASEAATEIQKRSAGAGLELSAAPPPSATHFLLYLAHETWVGEAGERLAEEVRHTMRTEQRIVMLHENDMNNGGCEVRAHRTVRRAH